MITLVCEKGGGHSQLAAMKGPSEFGGAKGMSPGSRKKLRSHVANEGKRHGVNQGNMLATGDDSTELQKQSGQDPEKRGALLRREKNKKKGDTVGRPGQRGNKETFTRGGGEDPAACSKARCVAQAGLVFTPTRTKRGWEKRDQARDVGGKIGRMPGC